MVEQSSSSKGSISRVANLLFGVERTILFSLSDNKLTASLEDGETLSVECQNERSQLALSYQQDQPITAGEDALTSIVDRQLLSRLGSSAMWLMPVGSGRGVLACGVNDKIGQDRNLIRAFRYLVSAEMSRQQEDQVPMIETELVMKQVNEVTHEVNNPLSIIQNYLHTLSLKLEENSPVQTDIETIKHELIRVSGIVEKYAQIGRRQDLLTREVDVNELIKPLAEVIRGGHENIEVEFNFDEAIPLLTITPDSLKQVIVNLIKNSAEALKDTSDATISISTHGSINLGGARYLEINVCDNGPGIPLSIRNEIFQRGTSNKEGEHSGLGLSIVNQLVADMGGMISCRSQVQSEGIAGTNFQILIPLVAEPAHPEIQD